MGNVGPLQLALIIGIALLLFGAGRIAEVGKGIGEGIRNFKKGLRDDDEDDPAKQLPPKTEAKEEDTHKPA
ncbi:prohead protease [Sorangium cellulosum]|uniref:Sec-independent protein translocase protein TatA n=1 Tax=Sorangium cellulosum TaxID=56 RepID=A0A4P2Q6Z6_SORCE|nr:twin-arginine translocase TatA/TatE family subunit [Sorangium cellulosum]AUX25277.1 prohead protease [Sorangium cellulosum]